ncbi:MAG: hypothetical protein ACQEWD_14260 [Bacteroidota bacterium]
MRISLVLKELNISFELLQEYGKLLEVDLSVPGYDVSEELLLQIKDLHRHEATRTKLIDLTVEKVAQKIGAYREGDQLKMLAKIKWFGDEARNGDYGFLEVPGFDDVFFHYKQVDNIPRGELRPERMVIIRLSETNLFAGKKKSVSAVSAPEAEVDIFFMLHCLVNLKGKIDYRYQEVLDQYIINLEDLKSDFTNKDREYFTQMVLSHLKRKSQLSNVVNIFSKLLPLFESIDFKPSRANEIANISETHIREIDYVRSEWGFIMNFRRFCGLEQDWELDEYISEVVPERDKLFWWSVHNLNIPIKSILEEMAKNLIQGPFNQDENLERLTNDETDKVFKLAFQNLLNDQEDKYSSDQIGAFVKLAFQHQKHLDLSLLGDEKLFALWDKKSIDYFPVNAVRAHLRQRSNDKKKRFYEREKRGNKTRELLSKLSTQQLRDIVSAIGFEEEKIRTSVQFQEFTNIIENLGIKEAKEKGLVDLAYNISSDYYKLQFFISDFTDELNYDEVVIYTGLLDASRQKLFFKKLIKIIEEGKAQLSLEDLTRITVIDYETSEYSKEIDGVGLDYTLSIIIKLLNDLKDGKLTRTKTIYDLVAQQVKRPDDLLVIDGFFDRCEGRTILKPVKEESNSKDGPTYTTQRDPDKKPRFSTFCDGRKALDRTTGEPSKCQKSGKEFWWCENAQCYEISRKKHQPKDYRNYSLADIMRILGISYQEEQYEKLLGIINRVNRFLSHMTCRSCNTILRPVNSNNNSNYAFYRVTRFHCSNSECKEKHQGIYLSHCLNGQCMDIIDSRDSVKCKTEGFDENCGWYICNNCFACCSTEKINGRKYIMQTTGQNYCCHNNGHKDLGKICCNKCGEEMEEKEQYGVLYQKQLTWFIDQYEKGHSHIPNAGKNRNNKWWFIWSQGNFEFEEFRKHLKSLYNSGFQIPDYHDLNKTTQLVAESYSTKNGSRKIFKCKNCDNTLKFNDLEEFSYARQRSIYNYHEHIFPREKVNN